MSGSQIKMTCCHCAILFFLALGGCQKTLEALPEVSVVIPDQFEDGGREWSRQSAMEPADNDCLSRFFERNRDLAGSPEFEGQPTVFLSGKRDRRFFWLHASADGNRWRSVEFKNRRFLTTDGTGSPFESGE